LLDAEDAEGGDIRFFCGLGEGSSEEEGAGHSPASAPERRQPVGGAVEMARM
jgi:hypothetical protein